MGWAERTNVTAQAVRRGEIKRITRMSIGGSFMTPVQALLVAERRRKERNNFLIRVWNRRARRIKE